MRRSSLCSHPRRLEYGAGASERLLAALAGESSSGLLCGTPRSSHAPLGSGVIRRDLLERGGQSRNLAQRHLHGGNQRDLNTRPSACGKPANASGCARRHAIGRVSRHGLRDLVRYAEPVR